jgi:hypothetical protein
MKIEGWPHPRRPRHRCHPWSVSNGWKLTGCGHTQGVPGRLVTDQFPTVGNCPDAGHNLDVPDRLAGPAGSPDEAAECSSGGRAATCDNPHGSHRRSGFWDGPGLPVDTREPEHPEESIRGQWTARGNEHLILCRGIQAGADTLTECPSRGYRSGSATFGRGRSRLITLVGIGVRLPRLHPGAVSAPRPGHPTAIPGRCASDGP